MQYDPSFAFSHKSDPELRRSLRILSLLQVPGASSWMPQILTAAIKLGLPLKWLVEKTLFNEFVGGKSLEHCIPLVNKLGSLGVSSILDYAVEGGKNQKHIDKTLEELLRGVEFSGSIPDIRFSVLKVSGLSYTEALKNPEKHPEEIGHLRHRLRTLCLECQKQGIRLMIDAEESWMQDCIDQIVFDLQLEFNREVPLVYNTLQMYRHDRLDYLKKCLEEAKANDIKLGYKLVRGAYLETENEQARIHGRPSPIYPNKKSVDQAFDEATELCIRHLDRVGLCVATHNKESVIKAASLIEALSIDPKHLNIEFCQLLGMSDIITFNLAHRGFNVSKYVPYGPVSELLPYLTRRAQENSSIRGQMNNELDLLKEELQRRKLAKKSSTPHQTVQA